MSANRTSAAALAAMALGLGLIYHAGPWFWMSRGLTILGSVWPLYTLAKTLTRQHPQAVQAAVAALALEAVLVLALMVMACNLVVTGEHPYRLYALANILSQVALSVTWMAWLTIAWRSWVAWLGTAMAAFGTVGFAMNAHLRYVGPEVGPQQYVPPDPWASTVSGDAGPVDMLSRVLPDLLPVEMGMVTMAVGVWLLVVALPWAKGRI
jgi:hypothetical protein